MSYAFSKNSNVTLVITSCGRFDLLKQTLDSFLKNNTYPIHKIIITEDSGNDNIFRSIPSEYESYFEVIINKEKLGQIRSIDKAYSLVETDYIFHCEDDWFFYREGFIEDSIKLMEADNNIYQVWLRSFYHDVAINYPFHHLGKKYSLGNTIAYKLLSSRDKWQGFSFNPGLRKLSDYLKIKGGYSSFLDATNKALMVESSLSTHMKELGKYAIILENDAIYHLGYGHHISDEQEKRKKTQKKIKITAAAVILFAAGWLIGFFS